MQNDNFEYKIGGYKAYQIYSFLRNEKKQPQYMNKRYFQAEHESFPNQKFFIMVYERKLFHEENLLIHLNELKNIEPQEHAPFPVIKQILENAEVKIDSEVKENVIALVMKKGQEENFISFFDFAGENPLFNENSIKKYTIKILEIIQFMSSKGFSSHFSPQSVFIGEDSGTLQIYGYGDQEFYRLKDERKKHSELWKVAFFIFTCLKQYPPYTNSSPTQAYYRMLKQRDYDKFWKQNSRSRPELSKLCQNFINLLFDQTELTTIEQIKAHLWLKQYEPITIQEIKLIQKKRKEQILKKREQIQKRIKQAAFKKQMNINVRSGGYKCCQNLLQEYEQEQERQRAFKKGKVDEKRLDLLFIGEITDKSFAVANLFCILEAQKHGQRARVSKVDKSKQSLITFHLETQLFADYLYQSDIKIELFLEGDILSIRLEEVYGTLYEAIWVKNYLKNLFVGV